MPSTWCMRRNWVVKVVHNHRELLILAAQRERRVHDLQVLLVPRMNGAGTKPRTGERIGCGGSTLPSAHGAARNYSYGSCAKNSRSQQGGAVTELGDLSYFPK
eukprot:scaffold74801_cov75-Phaeocystis_antarctica.AAC.5